jgi:hypothetical protein
MSTVTELLKNPESVGVWTLDSDQSTITFNNKTMWGVMKVNGVFTEFSGDGQITNSGTLFGRVDIKAASLNTKLGKRDADLRSPTFRRRRSAAHHSDHREPQEVGRDRKHARHGRRQDDAVDLPCVPAHRRSAVASAPGSAADQVRAAATQGSARRHRGRGRSGDREGGVVYCVTVTRPDGTAVGGSPGQGLPRAGHSAGRSLPRQRQRRRMTALSKGKFDDDAQWFGCVDRFPVRTSRTCRATAGAVRRRIGPPRVGDGRRRGAAGQSRGRRRFRRHCRALRPPTPQPHPAPVLAARSTYRLGRIRGRAHRKPIWRAVGDRSERCILRPPAAGGQPGGESAGTV